MSDSPPKNEKRCVPIVHPNIMPGWGCCVCNVYNGQQRTSCKNCSHSRCDLDPDKRAS